MTGTKEALASTGSLADDSFLIAKTKEQRTTLIEEIDKVTARIELEINFQKTKYIISGDNDSEPITISKKNLKAVDKYKC